MSEDRDSESSVPDSQETYYEKSQMLNESQDFALVVGEDSDGSTKNRLQAVENMDSNRANEKNVEKNIVQAETMIVNDDSTVCEIVNETPGVLSKINEIEDDKLKMKDEKEDGEESNDKMRNEDDDDMIQGTPPGILSPSRKLISGKRKGDSIEEPAAKIQRTLSQRDALTSEKDNKLIISNSKIDEKETLSNILCESTEDFGNREKLDIYATQRNKENVVIEETQDLQDSEIVALGDLSDDENEDGENKSKESRGKNESSVDRCDPQADGLEAKPHSSESDNNALLLDIETGYSRASKNISSETFDEAMEVTTNEKDDKESRTEAVEADDATDDLETKSTKEYISNDKESTKEKDDGVCKTDKEFSKATPPASENPSDSNCEAESNSSNKSRMSIELIYDRKSTSQEKKKFIDLVKIDENGEEIVLDSSNDDIVLQVSTCSSNDSPRNSTNYKTCIDSKTNSESSYKSTGWNEAQQNKDAIEISDCQITNGDEDLTISGTAKTISVGSDMLVDDVIQDTMKIGASKSAENDSDTDERFNLNLKLSETMELANVVSDSEGESLVVIENVQNMSQDKANISSNTYATGKTTVTERKTRFYVELRYLLHVDDATKEIICKEVTDVQCEPIVESSHARINSDTSGCLADISENANKDTSPGSVISNPQLFQLPTSRFSMASTISSSSSVSSAASLAAKLFKDVHFSLPKGRPRHAKRPAIETVSEDKLAFEKTRQRWKNACLITDTLLQSANMVISSPDIFQHETEPGISGDKVLSSTPEHASTDDKVLSSTPEPVQDEEVTSQIATPKSTKEKNPPKRNRIKSSNNKRSNGMRKASPELTTTSQEGRLPISKRKPNIIEATQPDKLSKTTSVSTPSRLRPGTPRMESLRSLTPQNLPNDELVGKTVFAKWSDNKYYPGEVTDQMKGKYRVKFYDGKSKPLIEEFVIPIPNLLEIGLSVYATTKEDDYGSMGIIVHSEDINGVIYYTVDVDNGKRVKVQTKDIFLTPDQAQILKEEVGMESKNLPKTPQRLDKVSLDNVIDEKRISRRPDAQTVSTPRSRKGAALQTARIIDSIPPSGSGIVASERQKTEISSSESETRMSDSQASSIEDVDGVQPELVAMPIVQISKGPSNRTKGRGRSKSKQTQEDAELGPIPSVGSTIFKDTSFILTSTSSDIISRRAIYDSCSETGTELEEEWLKPPFVKDRVKTQLINGGGTVYDSFKLIPQNEYKNTKLITNVPNLTAKSIQCLSVGITVYSHKWVIQCCRENRTLKPTSYELPAGWSIERNTYIESCERPTKQPFNGMIIGMPKLDDRNVANKSNQFWRRICENAGAGVQIIDDSESNFCHATAILTDNRCPSWIVEKADSWQIPLVSTDWVLQCIIAGQVLLHDSHPRFKHSSIQS